MGPRAKRKQVLSTTELDGLKSEKKELESSLRESEGYGSGTQGEQIDKGKIKAEIAYYDKEIHAGSPGRLTGKSKDSLYKEEKALEEQFKEGLPSTWEMDKPGKNPGAVRKHLSWLKRNENSGDVNRYREIQRSLRPGEERSIENLRKDR